MNENKIKNLLIDLGICDELSIEAYHPHVRDRDDVYVMRCAKSDVIFLSRSDHMDLSHYEEKEGFMYWSAGDRKYAVNVGHEDKLR